MQRLGAPVHIAQPPFMFDFVSREEQVRRYCDEVLLPRFQLFRAQQADKAKFAAAFFYGQSGIGKSRLSRDLLPQALRYLQQQQGVPSELLDLLNRSATLLIDLRHNGERVSDEELASLSADVIIGLRVAAKYVGHDVVGVRQLALRETGLREALALPAVLKAISDENMAAGTSAGMLHLTIDEVHFFFDTSVRYQGGAVPAQQTEPPARAIMRSVMGACNTAVRPGLSWWAPLLAPPCCRRLMLCVRPMSGV